jgi:hypothetical protein
MEKWRAEFYRFREAESTISRKNPSPVQDEEGRREREN